MKLQLQRLFDRLPPPLQPRGVRRYPVSLHHSAILKGSRIFVLPTREGVLFMAVLLVMLLGATNYGNSMAFALTFLLGSMLFVSVFHTYRNLVNIELRLAQIADAFAGGHATFAFELHNSAARPRFDITLRSSGDTATTVTVAAGDGAPATLALPAPRRGRLELGRITLECRYPFGLFRAWSYVDVEGAALIYPRPGYATAPHHSGTAAGEGMESSEPGSDDFHGLRGYQEGDSLRHIHWQALAREQGLVTREFQRHQSPELWFDWQSAAGRNAEERLSRLCRWVLDAEARQQRYGLRLPGVEIAPAAGAAQRQRCLRQLALFGVAP